MNVFGLLGAGIALAGAVWVGVDVGTEPPGIVGAGPWVMGCERVPGGVRVEVAGDAPCLCFDFVGLGGEAALGYLVLGADGASLGAGVGTTVDFPAWAGARRVLFYSLEGDADWAGLSEVSARERDGASPGAGVGRGDAVLGAAGRGDAVAPRARAALGADGFVVYEETTATARWVYPPEDEASGEAVVETSTVGSLSGILVSGAYPSGEGAFSVSVAGNLLVRPGTRFRAGADDTASVSVGGATSGIGGEHAFRWGNWATAPGEGAAPVLMAVSAGFSTVGGPYQFAVEGLEDLTFYREAGRIPFAGLSVEPARFTVPWSGEGLEGRVSYGPVDGRVTYSGPSCEGPFVSVAEDVLTVDGDAFLRAGARPSRATVSLVQSYGWQVYTNAVEVALEPDVTSLALSPGSLTVTNASDGGSVAAVGADAPALTYELRPDAGGVVRVEGLSVSAGDVVLALRDRCLGENVSTNVSWEVEVPWVARYKGVAVTNDVAALTVRLEISSKVGDDCECACAEGTGTDVEAGCVAFRQAFGRTPGLAGMPVGALAIEAENLSAGLFTPEALRYDHPMMRRLDVRTWVVTDAMGRAVTYGRDGRPVGADVAADSRLEALPDGRVREVFADRSAVVYDASGAVAEIVSPAGVRAAPDELGIVVERDAQGRIARVASEADGELAVEVLSPTAYNVVWRDRAGAAVKTFAFSREGEGTLLLMDGPFPVRWRWEEAAHDFAMTRGAGEEALTTARSVVYDGATVRVARTMSRGGVVGATETETIDSANGNAVVGRTRGGRALSSATRVTAGDGLGRIASRVDERGLETTYAYDAAGRVVSRREVGASTNVTAYVYSAEPFDRRPWRTEVSVDGVVTRVATFAEATLLDGGRVEVETDCGLTTSRVYWPADAANRFAAGRLRAEARPDGRMTAYDYDEATRTVTATEGLADAETGALVLVPGRSTRTLTTYDAGGDAVRIAREALIGEAWAPLTWEVRRYNAAHQHVGSTFSDGRETDSRWICTGPLWEVDARGVATTNVYDSLKQRVASTRHGPHGALTTATAYDAAGRVARTTRGELAAAWAYDQSGRLTEAVDEQGRVTATAYPDAWTTVETLPGGGTRITTVDAEGRVASVTGTAVTPEWHTYGPGWERVAYGAPDGARWEKTWRDGLGRVTRVERAGANGSVLVTENSYNAKGQLARVERTGQAPVVYVYDAWGDRVSEQVGARLPRETATAYVLVDGEPWLETVVAVSNLTQSVRVDAEGLSQVSTDVRGNETETVIEEEGAWRTVTTTFPGVGNPSVEVALDGVTVQTVSASCVTNSTAYDKYLRVVAETDGRGNVTARAYDARGRLASVTDAVGATTAYGYDEAGRVCAVTNALGNVTVYEYDVRGNKTYEGGAVYPVVYDYDLFGQKVGMTTFRDEASGEGDSTTWAYDEATGALLSKTYADGHGVAYTLTDLGQAATRTDARGNVTAYAYNVYGDLVSQTYSDGTPAVGYVYDVFGRQAQATDAVGTTTFGYNAYGELETESITGEYAKTLTHHFDAYGRDAGYSVNGSRRMTLGYDPATGRLATMNEGGAFAWAYLPGSDLKARLTYPNGLTVEWAYEPGRDLLTAVTNSLPDGTTLSTYVYANDLLGRRVSKNDEQYGYDFRDQLTSADARSYAYDDIGNRTVAEGRAYAANALNQYTAIDAFEPEYDADGNQTKVLTDTGVWAVEYNAENRPIRWTQGNTVVTMGYDRLGRRVFHKEMAGNRQITYTKFLYNGYLCVQQLFSNSPWNVYKEFIWDPTEPVATRPLCFRQNAKRATFLLHDGNKNVTDVVTVGPFNEPVANYDYAPFGAVAAAGSRAADNPFRFSSEFHDDALALVYYNYRHYNPLDGRWLGRDVEDYSDNLYSFVDNSPLSQYDRRGLKKFEYASEITWADFQGTIPSYETRNGRVAETVLAQPYMSINEADIDFSIVSSDTDCICVQAIATRAKWIFYFLEDKSWATEEAKQSWQILAHERTHINIYLNAYKRSSLPMVSVCATTYDGAKAKALKSLQTERDELRKTAWDRQNERNLTFDEETNHGQNMGSEQEWEENVYSEMYW